MASFDPGHGLDGALVVAAGCAGGERHLAVDHERGAPIGHGSFRTNRGRSGKDPADGTDLRGVAVSAARILCSVHPGIEP